MIKVSAGEGLLKVTSPYNKEFVSFARMRGGKWSDGQKVWMFDPRDEFAVRSVLIDIFGTDELTAPFGEPFFLFLRKFLFVVAALRYFF